MKTVNVREEYTLEEADNFVIVITDVHGDNVSFSTKAARQLRNDLDVWLALNAIEERVSNKQYKLQF